FELVGHVSEEGAPRSEPFDPRKGLLDVGMAGVGLRTQGVDDEHVEIFEQGKAGLGDAAHVGEVGGGAEAEGGNRKTAMENGHTLKAHASDIGGLLAVQ